VQNQKISEPKNGNASLATEPTRQAEESSDDFVDASSSLPTDLEIDSASAPVAKAVKEEEQLQEPVKEEEVDDSVVESLSVPIDLEAKNGDASLITEAMKKEEEQLEEARIKAEEEEEARKREEAAKLAFDPEARYSKLDQLLTKTQLFSEFLLEKMDRIADVCVYLIVLTVFMFNCSSSFFVSC
jgi:ATP-dependent DNA helicase